MRRTLCFFLLVLPLILVFLGNCSSAKITFDTSCTHDSDCVAVGLGCCHSDACPDTAINRKDVGKVQDARADLDCTDHVCVEYCIQGVAVCDKGTCTLAAPCQGQCDAGTD